LFHFSGYLLLIFDGSTGEGIGMSLGDNPIVFEPLASLKVITALGLLEKYLEFIKAFK
jgi:hypothetical protein